MSTITLFLGLGAALWLVGLHGLLIRRHPLRRIIAINVMSSGVFMIMIALAKRSDPADPVMHALVVTGLVVAVSATAFALRLAAARPTERARSREQQ
ncbi:NADH-quinone oxidoreductase subunit K [Pseudomonas sp.]|uniref:NADH-quinone oxidoreductase subunit K n=1 Tax=Pseudomonas sp. TaxID=306 RepID=UPI00272C897B|nr:NADH-quinone oxidoreductase subunit K [Pseudomonas sp.]